MLEVYAVRNGDGELILDPSDFHTDFGMSVSDWIRRDDRKKISSYHKIGDINISDIESKMNIYIKARTLYYELSGTKDLSNLREEPWIIENFIPWDDNSNYSDPSYIFIFKEENNGTTYRIVS